MKKIKCFIVGDEGVGKASLFDAFTISGSLTDPRFVFDNAIYNMIYENTPISIEFWNAYTKEYMDFWISSQFPQTDIFLVCFSVVDEQSLENVSKIWEPKIRQYSSNPFLILIGCKCDLKNKYFQNDQKIIEEGLKPIPTSKCFEMKDTINAHDYIECSAYCQTGLETILNSICHTYLHKS